MCLFRLNFEGKGATKFEKVFPVLSHPQKNMRNHFPSTFCHRCLAISLRNVAGQISVMGFVLYITLKLHKPKTEKVTEGRKSILQISSLMGKGQ